MINQQKYIQEIKSLLQGFLRQRDLVDTGALLNSIDVNFNFSNDIPVTINIISEDYLIYLDILQDFYREPQLERILEDMFSEILTKQLEEE